VFVTEKMSREPLAPTYPVHLIRSGMPRDVVIVGVGAAGCAATEMLRRCGYDGRLTIVDADEGVPYDRPNLSKDYLAGTAPEDWIPLRSDGFYAEHGVNHIRGRATRIDPARKVVTIRDRETIPYDALLLATGAEPVRLDLPGGEGPQVHYLRSLVDSRAILAAAQAPGPAVVIGAGFIGLEVAASLRARNLEVHVVGREAVPLGRVLGDHLGSFIRSLHEEHGVVFHLNRSPARIESDAVVLDDGSRMNAKFVVIGVGVRPRLDLAEQAGLAMDKGLSVDEYLETSAPGISAAGDLARWPDPHSGDRIRVEHWVVAQRQGQTAARNILGARERFDQVPFFWSAHYDVSINYVGHAEKWDEIVVDGDVTSKDCLLQYKRNGRVLAVASVYRDVASLEAELAMERARSP
jgi:NADPH-dependent 2,4-dienoyl-CoA reductase/sulfur reductase-like enzyme